MTTITLQDYLQQIDELIDERRFDEAMAHCRHILKRYPRHVDTYRMLAKVLLEKGEYQGAIELMQRVLSADPNDFIAHVGLSMAFKETEALPQATWHLERALELKPYNAALQEELVDLYSAQGTAVPPRLAPSQSGLARLYAQGEMYPAAADELRHAISEDDDRIDLKVLLAETLWRDNQRVEAVALCLEILKSLPNCIQANAILGEVWLQTGRTEEAQTYLKRVQALTQVDKAHCDGETAVCRAFQAHGAPPIPENVTIERLEEGDVPEIVETADSDWMSAMALENDDAPIESTDIETFDWLSAAALADTDETAVEAISEDARIADELVADDLLAAGMMGDGFLDDDTASGLFTAESDWFADSDEQEDEDLSDLLGDAGDGADLDEWLHDLDQAEDLGSADAEDADAFPEGAASQPDASEPGASDSEFEALFADLETTADAQTGDEPVPDDSFGEGFTDLFSDLELADESPTDDEPVGAETAVTDGLSTLAEEPQPDDADYHTGYTNLFDDLSTEAFPKDELPDWLESEKAAPVEEDEPAADETVSDWLADVESVQVDDRLDSGWLSGPSEPNEVAGGETAVSEEIDRESTLAQAGEANQVVDDKAATTGDASVEEDNEIPTWLLGDQTAQEFETPPPLESMDGLLVDPEDLSEFDELAEGADVPTWLLGGDSVTEDTSALESTPPADEIDSEGVDAAGVDAISEDDLASLAGEELPDWLLGDEAEAAFDSQPGALTDITDLGADLVDESFLELAGEPDTVGEPDIDESDEEIPDWLLDHKSSTQEELEAGVIGDNDKDEEIRPQEEPEEIADGTPDTQNNDELGWLEALGDSQDLPVEDLPIPDGDESASFASRIAGGEGGAIDEAPTQVNLPEEPTESAVETSEDEALPFDAPPVGEEELAWLDQLDDVASESVDEQITLDWSQDDQELEDVLAGVTGELKADLAWLDTLAEEGEEDDQLLDSGEEEKIGTSDLAWLDELSAGGDTGPLADFGEEPALPEFEGSLAGLLDESDGDIEWLSEIGEETADKDETAEELAAADDSVEMEVESELALEPEPEAESLPDFDEIVSAVSEEDGLEGAADILDDADEALLDDDVSLDDAMAWLETLAAKQGAPLEELPSVMDGAADEIEAALDLEAEAAQTLETEMDLLFPESEQDGSEPAAETAPEVEKELEGDELPADVPEDLDDAMAWLESLAAEQGAPLEELPSIAGVVDEPPVDERPSESEPAEEPETAESQSELAEALDWLEQLAREDGVEVGKVAVGTAVPAVETDLNEALDWLEQLAQTEAAPAEPTADAPVAEKTVPAAEDETLFDLADAMPDDPDEALAWLQQLAVEEGVEEEPEEELKLEEETAVTDVVVEETKVVDLETEPVIEDEAFLDIPDDPDAAMAWLEQLAANQGAPLEELPSVTAVDEAAAAVDESGAIDETAGETAVEPAIDESETAVEESHELDVPDDPDAAMAWLEQLAANQGARLEELPSVTAVDEAGDEFGAIDEIAGETAVEPAIDESETTAEESPELDVPEDMDEAMAWLEELAAQQGAAIEELPSLSEKPEQEPPLEPDAGKIDIELAAETAAGEAADVPIAAKDTDETELPAIEEDDDLAETVADAMPDWLDADIDAERPGQTAWLRSLDEPDVIGWLEEEADATVSDVRDQVLTDKVESLADMSFGAGPLSAETDFGLDTGPLTLPEDEIVTSVLDLDESQLADARQAVQDGAYDKALAVYQELVDAGGGMMTLIADLEAAADEHVDQPLFRHLLGDAYMRNGQLQKALDTYRQALDQI